MDDPSTLQALKALYSVMQSVENRLGGGEGVEGLYGSIKRLGMQKVLQALVDDCGLGPDSHLVDIGAGLGRPLLHAALWPGVRCATGVELDAVKVAKADAFVEHSLTELARRGVVELPGGSPRGKGSRGTPAMPVVECSDIEEVLTLDPATHAYAFWEGIPTGARQAFGRLFASSATLQAVAVVQRSMRARPPPDVMRELHFGRLALTASFPVAMSGSGRSFTAYVFRRTEPFARGLARVLAAPDAPAATEAKRPLARIELTVDCRGPPIPTESAGVRTRSRARQQLPFACRKAPVPAAAHTSPPSQPTASAAGPLAPPPLHPAAPAAEPPARGEGAVSSPMQKQRLQHPAAATAGAPAAAPEERAGPPKAAQRQQQRRGVVQGPGAREEEPAAQKKDRKGPGARPASKSGNSRAGSRGSSRAGVLMVDVPCTAVPAEKAPLPEAHAASLLQQPQQQGGATQGRQAGLLPAGVLTTPLGAHSAVGGSPPPHSTAKKPPGGSENEASPRTAKRLAAGVLQEQVTGSPPKATRKELPFKAGKGLGTGLGKGLGKGLALGGPGLGLGAQGSKQPGQGWLSHQPAGKGLRQLLSGAPREHRKR